MKAILAAMMMVPYGVTIDGTHGEVLPGGGGNYLYMERRGDDIVLYAPANKVYVNAKELRREVNRLAR